MPYSHWQRLFLTVVLTLSCTLSVLARSTNGLHWEKIHVYKAAPTVMFAKLGLTHSTKNGYTRDGKQGVPDPTFPPGLTDVVPDDAEKILLVRGTASGVSLFRARVATADTLNPPLHLHAELQVRSGDSDTSSDSPIGMVDQDGVGDGVPTQISLGDGDAVRVYQITVRANPDGTEWVACRISLPLPPAPPTDTPSAAAVFVPDRVWTDPQSRKIHPGETVIFKDLAAVRQAAARRLGATGVDGTDDYTVRITLTPNTPHE
ncbi:MAG: hypothetical protein ACRYFS_11760 [Janthinobacterium lividum]